MDTYPHQETQPILRGIHSHKRGRWWVDKFRTRSLLLLLLLSHFSRVRLCDPIDGSHQPPPSLGFSRQEHWSGLPFPSPMQESEKGKWNCSVVSDSSRPHGLQPTRFLHPWDFPGKSASIILGGLLTDFFIFNSYMWHREMSLFTILTLKLTEAIHLRVNF